MTKKKDHPISGGKAVVECLKANNIKYVFLLMRHMITLYLICITINEDVDKVFNLRTIQYE